MLKGSSDDHNTCMAGRNDKLYRIFIALKTTSSFCETCQKHANNKFVSTKNEQETSEISVKFEEAFGLPDDEL